MPKPPLQLSKQLLLKHQKLRKLPPLLQPKPLPQLRKLKPQLRKKLKQKRKKLMIKRKQLSSKRKKSIKKRLLKKVMTSKPRPSMSKLFMMLKKLKLK